MPSTVEEHRQDGWLVVAVLGDLDLYTSTHVRDALSAALVDAAGETTHGVVVDLFGVEFMDSAGLGVLVGAYQRSWAHQTPLRLAGASPQVMQLLTITGLSRLFAVFPSVRQACRDEVPGSGG